MPRPTPRPYLPSKSGETIEHGSPGSVRFALMRIMPSVNDVDDVTFVVWLEIQQVVK